MRVVGQPARVVQLGGQRRLLRAADVHPLGEVVEAAGVVVAVEVVAAGVPLDSASRRLDVGSLGGGLPAARHDDRAFDGRALLAHDVRGVAEPDGVELVGVDGDDAIAAVELDRELVGAEVDDLAALAVLDARAVVHRHRPGPDDAVAGMQWVAVGVVGVLVAEFVALAAECLNAEVEVVGLDVAGVAHQRDVGVAVLGGMAVVRVRGLLDRGVARVSQVDGAAFVVEGQRSAGTAVAQRVSGGLIGGVVGAVDGVQLGGRQLGGEAVEHAARADRGELPADSDRHQRAAAL